MKSDLAPRVVVVDDDPLMRRFVEICLEDQRIDLVSCASVAQALDAMRVRPPAVIITDLMMPRQGGLDLLRRLRDEPALAPGAQVAVFSAGVQPGDHRTLTELGARRIFEKPVTTQALSQFVAEAIAAGTRAHPAAVSEITLRNFGGDVALWAEFRSDCLAQFPLDLANGTAALGAGDMTTIRRVAHDLKSVLRLLGEAGGSDSAAAVEQAAACGDEAAAAAAWQAVRRAVEALLTDAKTS